MQSKTPSNKSKKGGLKKPSPSRRQARYGRLVRGWNWRTDPELLQQAETERIKRGISRTDKWWPIANGEFGSQRINEGKMMLAREEQRIKQLQDIANHAPAEPTVEVMAYNAFSEKDDLKANGFRWNGSDKCWYKSVKVANLDATLSAIGATVDSTEKLLAGL